MAKNKKGYEKTEYPKLIRVAGIQGKVRVLNAEEEAKYQVENKTENKTEETKKPTTGWGTP